MASSNCCDRIEPGGLGFLVARDGLGGVGDAGAVDQHALLAMRLAGSGESCCYFLVAGDIDLAKYAANIGRDLLAPLDVAVEHRDPGSAPRELSCAGLAEARSSAGDDR